MLNRRHFVALAAAASASGALPAFAQDTTVSGEITLTAYTGIFQDKYTEAVIAPFMKAFPNVKVNYFASRASSETLGQLRAQKGAPQSDVVIFDTTTALIGNKEGLLSPMTVAEVPNLADLAPQAIVQKGYGPAVTFDNFVMMYNTETVKTPLSSFGDLWKPEFKGKIALTSMPSILGTCAMVVTSKLEGEDFTKSVSKAAAKLKELAPSIQTFDPKPDGYTIVINGTADVGTGWNARAQTYAIQSKGKLAVVVPAEGSVLQINTINLVEGSKNKAAALAFINYALSPEAQAAFTEAMFYAPVNLKAKVSAEAQQRTVVGQLDKMIPFDWGWAAEKSNQWNQIWKREIIAAGN